MKKRIFYTIFILLLFLLTYWLNKDVPIQYQWQPTYSTNDKEPFGAYAFDKILKDSWQEDYYQNDYSFYDIAGITTKYPDDEDSDTAEINPKYNLLIVSFSLDLDSTETEFLLKYVRAGGSVILSANFIFGPLDDSLNIAVVNPSVFQYVFDLSKEQTAEQVRFCAPDSTQTTLSLPQALVKNHFEIPDTVNNAYFNSLYRISTVSDDKTVSLRYAIGEGNLILVANPLVFTNYGILNDSINPYIWKHLAYLKGKPLMRTEYYEMKSQEMDSPGGESRSIFGVILRERALRWAFYTTLAGIFIFMIFTAKRKQKIIPVINPPANKMLDFVGSIAGLYLLKNNNADILLKKQIYWGEELKRKYGIDIVNEPNNYDLYKRVATKTRMPFDEVCGLFINLRMIDKTTSVSDEQMMELVAKMNEFRF